jgi:hypothetical protein
MCPRLFVLRGCLLCVLILGGRVSPFGQEQQAVETALEETALAEDGQVPEEDGLVQHWDYLRRHPVNLNRADLLMLQSLPGITPVQAAGLLQYRALFGPFLDLMELQAVPGWDISTIRQVLPFVQIRDEVQPLPLFRERMQKGEHIFLVRSSLRRDVGSAVDALALRREWPGAAAPLMVRYSYRFRNLLQWGVTMEKDAGERFFPAGVGKGPGFWTAHLAIRSVGKIRAAVLGDYHINLGQGLIHWQSMAFRKTASPVQVFRQGFALKPYQGIDENRFHRGFAVDLGRGRFGWLIFGASDRMDAATIPDTTGKYAYHIGSVRTSGLHRTASEIAGRNALHQSVAGSSVYWSNGRWKLAWNGMAYAFRFPLVGSDDAYRFFQPTGRRWLNHSIDYSGTVRNVFLFGEIAQAGNGAVGWLQGLIASIDRRVDLSLVIRHLPNRYRAFHANAFTALSAPGGETGWYTGLSVRLHPAWRLDAWWDIYRVQWLQYRVDRPSIGRELMVSLHWKPSKILEWQQRFFIGQKEVNPSSPELPMVAPDLLKRFQYRSQWAFQPSRNWQIRSRAELVWVHSGSGTDRGMMVSADMVYKPPRSRLELSFRLAGFDADSYAARLYQFERDVQYYFAITPFYRRGIRTYLLLDLQLTTRWTCWIKYGGTFFNDQGSALLMDEDMPVARHSLHMQLRYLYSRSKAMVSHHAK